MRYDYDVIVVGARVAGASTARLLAGQGHRVLLVDRVKMPADTVSTHAILRTGVFQLARWGLLDRVVAAGTPPIRGVTLGFGGERVRFQIRNEHGIDALCAPRRYVLDGLLQDAAVDAGAELATGTRVTGLRQNDAGRVIGVEIDGNHDRTLATAKFVVGADGLNSRIAEAVNAQTRQSHRPTNAIHYAYFTGVDSDGFWFQFTPGINAGLVPTNDGATCVFVGRNNRHLATFRADPDGEFRRLLEAAGADLAERVLSASRVSPLRGTPGLTGFVRQAWGAGWALVGDAGYTKDPISAHGISAALRDAELCARAIDRALRNPDEEADAMGQFERTRDTLSRQLFRESQALARYQWDAEEASRRMRAVSAAIMVECDTLAALPSSAAPAVQPAPEVAAVNGEHTNTRAPNGELQQIGSAASALTAQ